MEVTQRFPRPADRPAAILELFHRDGKLFTRIEAGPERELVPVSAHHFRRPEQTVATMAITTNEAGDVILQGDLGNYRRLSSE